MRKVVNRTSKIRQAKQSTTDSRLYRQIEFIVEIDKLKQIFRQTYLMDKSRTENAAEHSWHLSIMLVVLAEYSNLKIDVLRVLKMLLIHDLVEIDAGDTFLYDASAKVHQADREKQAAGRIFALLPSDQADDMRRLWDEFEQRETSEAKFARTIDRLQPLLHNYYTKGETWKRHGIRADKVQKNQRTIADASPILGDLAQKLIDESIQKGYLLDK